MLWKSNGCVYEEFNFPILDKSHASSNFNDENGLNICIYLLGQHWLDGRARKDVGECEYLYSEPDSVKT